MEQEEILKKQLQQGSSTAFEGLFRMYHKDLCNYVFSIIHDEDETKGIAQECFIKLWEKRDEINRIQSVKSYLFRSAYNTCLNKFKHQKVVEKHASEARSELQAIFQKDFENTYDEELAKRVMAAVEDLPTKNKEVFKLRYISGLNTAEVSEELGITPRTVETHVSNALKILRSKFSKYGHLVLFLIFFY